MSCSCSRRCSIILKITIALVILYNILSFFHTMDKQFLVPSCSASDYKLTKSASFSELSRKKKIVIEKQYQTQTHGNLFKQYSCEEIFDRSSNTSQIKVSQTYKTDDAERVDTWEKTVPSYNSLIKHNWLNNIDTQTNFPKPFPNQNQALTETSDVISRTVISPAKFIVDENKLKQLSIKEQNNLVDNKQVYTKSENSNETSNYLFKKPFLSLDQKSKYEKSDNSIRTPELTNKSCKEVTKEENRKHKLDTSELKKRLRSLVAIEPKQKSKMFACWSLTFFILLPVAIIFLALALSNGSTAGSFCAPRFDLKKITQELKRHVYDQDIAISELAIFFDEKDNQTSFEVMVFVGGIGVGKSYAAEIIKSNIKDTDKILDFFPPMYNKEDQAYSALSVCRCNLIRLENLKTDDIADVASFISNLKMRAEKYCVLVLAIFNTEEVDHNLKRTINYDRSISIIKDKFGKVGLQPTIASFTALSNEALVKCIEDAGVYNNVKLSSDNIDYVMRDLLVAESGCKGAYAKVLLVGKP